MDFNLKCPSCGYGHWNILSVEGMGHSTFKCRHCGTCCVIHCPSIDVCDGSGCHPEGLPPNWSEYVQWRYWLINVDTGLIEDGSNNANYWNENNNFTIVRNMKYGESP